MRSVISLLAAAAMAMSGIAHADNISDTIAKAIEDGTIKLSFRYRYEFVEEDLFLEDAHASTLKSRLSFAPNFGEDWHFLVEFDDVRHVGNDTFNDTRNGKTERPAVLDPEGSDLNQALVRYSGFENANIIFGRQRINRGTQRYIGGVGWRQNEQTYDSIAVGYGAEGPFKAFYSYVWNVNRIFGPERGTPARELDSNSHLLDAEYSFNKALNLGGYLYFIDLDDAASFSNATYGVRLDGAAPLAEDLKVNYVAEYAYQEDHGSNMSPYDADYYFLEGGLEWRQFGFNMGFEVLGGGDEPGGGFRTPLATLHKFQGWADRFVGRSAAGSNEGIEDFYLGVSAKVLDGTFQVIYHDFNEENGSGNLGSEWNASANWAFADHYGVLIKFASYDADEFSLDLTKFWIQLTASF